MTTMLWILAGLLTVWLMYGQKESVPVFKAIVIAIFGLVSLFVWCVANVGKSVPNPFYTAATVPKSRKR